MGGEADSFLMKALRQLGFLKLPFRQDDPSAEAEDERVLALFRNRAELKKNYGELQEEIYRLKDRIKQQEGATVRVQEMLTALELRLGVPESAYPTVVFYQLRRLWQSGREVIEQFVGDLVKQQEERERRQHLAEHNRRQFSKREGAEKQLRAAETCAAEAIEKEPLPEFPGLLVETRRAINLAAIAYAEVLCQRLMKTPLVRLAREATSRREATDEYGTRQECEALMDEIDRGRTLVQSRTNIAQEVKARSDRIKQVARYRNPADTSPMSDSIVDPETDLLDTQATGVGMTRMPNVLSEDTWDLFRILLR